MQTQLSCLGREDTQRQWSSYPLCSEAHVGTGGHSIVESHCEETESLLAL